MTAIQVVDGHAHIFSSAAASPRATDELAPADREAPAEDLLRRMAAAGVDAAVLVALDEVDDDVADALERHPGRFAAVAVATPAELGTAGVDPVAAARARREGRRVGALRVRDRKRGV